MEEAEPPECPVCLQTYDAVSAIPRVLTCGHTTCEACLKRLPNPFPNTIRCTVCTLLVKFLNCPSSLPKNLDLLHFSSALQNRHQTKEKRVIAPSSPPPENGKNLSILFPLTVKSWSYEFYRKWKKWILPKDCISVEEFGSESDGGVYGTVKKYFESDHVMGCVLKEKEIVGLFRVGNFVEDEGNSQYFNSSYESRIVSVLCGMKEEGRTQLEILLRATLRVSSVGKAYGFWYSDGDKCVYMVFERFKSLELKCVLKQKEDEEEKLTTDEMKGLGMLVMQICEILSRLHLERLVIGFLSVSSFGFDEFGHVYINLSEILNTGTNVNMSVLRGCKDLEVNLESNLFQEDLVFISPEMLLQFLVKEGFELDWAKSRYEVGSASDVWSLACLIVWLILGGSFLEEMESFLHFVVNATKDKKSGCDYCGLYTSSMGKIAALLGCRLSLEFASLKDILFRCLSFDPKDRPVITELWRFSRDLMIKPQSDMALILKQDVKKENSGHSVVLGELCYIVKECDKNKDDRADVELSINGDVAENMSLGQVKCTEMKGHLDCITGLAIGGGFLFSSSYDKIVRVWSLQDFTQVHSFKGHEHRITALVFIDGDQQLCISGDNEGVICVWEATFPFSECPLKKLYEPKDWRYSGIHAMAVSGTEYLYTGSGDKLVKAWSLKDYNISCSMSGHKSVVSSLVVSEGVLFTGSWDGTVRLWSIVDHSPLTVLGQDTFGNVASVSSLYADRHLLFVGHENGSIKIWHNDVLLKSIDTHKGAVFSVCKKGKWLFSGGWDKTISVQEISEEDVIEMEVTPIGSIACNSTITALAYWNGKIFVGQADRIIKVYHGM